MSYHLVELSEDQARALRTLAQTETGTTLEQAIASSIDALDTVATMEADILLAVASEQWVRTWRRMAAAADKVSKAEHRRAVLKLRLVQECIQELQSIEGDMQAGIAKLEARTPADEVADDCAAIWPTREAPLDETDPVVAGYPSQPIPFHQDQ